MAVSANIFGETDTQADPGNCYSLVALFGVNWNAPTSILIPKRIHLWQIDIFCEIYILKKWY